jgi:hypothetical protein
MIIPESKKQIKRAKKRLIKLIDDHKITRKDVADDDRCPIGYQTVKEHFSADHPYWNQDVANLVFEMIEDKKKEIEEKKNALLTK